MIQVGAEAGSASAVWALRLALSAVCDNAVPGGAIARDPLVHRKCEKDAHRLYSFLTPLQRVT